MSLFSLGISLLKKLLSFDFSRSSDLFNRNMKEVTYIYENFPYYKMLHYKMEIAEINFSNTYYYHIVYITYMCNLKYKRKWTYLWIRNRLIHREQTCGCQRWGAGESWTGSLGLADAIIIYRWINNNILLYSTESCIEYPVINHNRK